MNYVKYPKTFHLPWSESINSDDKKLISIEQFVNKKVIITIKMDGENTTMYSNHIHARSIDSKNHISRDWVKAFWSKIKHDIPQNYRICGENLYAKHSIYYQNLPSYFLGFSVWNGNICLSWDDTLEWFDLLNIIPVTVIYDGIFDENVIKKIKLDLTVNEGYVLRINDSFNLKDFNTLTGKFVRKNHIQTNKHWKNQSVVVNNVLHL